MATVIRGIKEWFKTHLTPIGKAPNIVHPSGMHDGKLKASRASNHLSAPRQHLPVNFDKPLPPPPLPPRIQMPGAFPDKPLPPDPPLQKTSYSQRKPVPERVPQQTQAPAKARGQATVQMIEERAPFSARNLGRMIANAKLQMAEMDPASRARCEANLIRTFEEMDRAVQDHRGSGLPSFVERVLMVADENVGVNDLALVGDLVAASTRMVRHGKPMSEAAISAVQEDAPFDPVTAGVDPVAGASVFERLRQSDFIGARCLSKIIGNAFGLLKDWNTLPQVVDGFKAALGRTFKALQDALERHVGGGNPPFVEQVLEVAVENVGQDDMAILRDLVPEAEVKPPLVRPEQQVPINQRKPISTPPPVGDQVLDRPEPPMPTTYRGNPLSEHAQRALKHALPLDEMIAAKNLTGEAGAFKTIQERDPIGGKCMAQMLAQVEAWVHLMDPEDTRGSQVNLTRTLQEMEGAMRNHRGAGLPPFVEEVLALAVENVGACDMMITLDLAPNARQSPLDKLLEPPLDEPRERPLHHGKPLSDAALAAVNDAMPFDRWIARFSPAADVNVFARLQENDPIGGKCLSQIIRNAIAGQDIDPRLQARYEKHMGATLKAMQHAMENHDGPGNPPFVDKVLALAVDNVGKNDLAIFGNLAFHAKVEPLGFIAVRDLHLPLDTACHRESTKWAGCQVVGAPFKYEGMNIDRIADKDAEYGVFFDASTREARKAGLGEQAGADIADEHFIRKWLADFKDANGDPHPNQVAVEPLQRGNPVEVLAQRPLKPGEVLIVSYEAMGPNGQMVGSHTMSLSAASDPPQLFDTNSRSVYNIERADLGSALERFVTAVTPKRHSLQWCMTRVSPSTPPI